ncbi:hypothetical protein FPRO04_04861 [Fusarium proliferatum]|nr:hypothetical protein FPRO04_04861 [Fusarium proliferatum]
MAPPTEEQLMLQSVLEYEVAEKNPLRPGEKRSDSYLQTLSEQYRRLPIMQTENFHRFLKLYKANQVVVFASDTGSDDSTQLTKRIMYLELNKGLKVVCTQPDQGAAKELGQRVSAELDVTFGEQVGVQYRKYNKTSNRTRLKFVTEGMLLQQIGDNPTLAGYSCVIIDFHERTKNTDLLLPRLRTPSLSVPTSKSVPKVLNIEKDVFSVMIQYINEANPDYCEMALDSVRHIHKNKAPGDILVFLASNPQVNRAVAKLRGAYPDMETFPLHRRLSQAEKAKALRSGEKRRCVITTNIAESSITVDDIVYVVDGGVEMQSVYNSRVRMHTIQAAPISKESADQRAKCAGRTQPGICYRLYTMATYDNILPDASPPSMLKDCFTTAIFALKSAGIKSVGTFDFLDPRREEVYLRGLEDLRAMNFIDENGTITPAGTAAFTLPIDLVWHNAFEEAIELGCLSELIDIAALVSVKNPICLIPPETLHAADVLHEQFMDPLSDHLSELNALYAYLHRKRNMSTEELAIWCHETFLNSASLEEALELRQKLIQWCKEKLGVSEISFLTPHDKDYHVKIRKAIAKGFVHHAGIKDVTCHQRQYLTLENTPVFLFPRSALGTDWQWVVYHRIETFDYQYMDRCTVVEQDWLLKMPPLPEVDALKRLCSTMELCSGPLTSPISEIFTNDCTKESPPRCPKACLEAESPYDRRLCEMSSYYLQDPKHLVFLMLQIAKVVDDHPKPTGPHVTKERGFDVYSVTTVDLHNIRDALETMELHYGEGSEAGEFTIPTNLILEKYLASSGIENDVPHGIEQLLDFIVRSTIACLFHLFILTAADTMRPGLYSCEPCLRKAMDWYPIETSLKQLPDICIDEEGFDRENFFCNVCDEHSVDVDFSKDYGGCDGGTQRMGSLLERFIKHASDNLLITKKAYDSDPKTIQLREMASRAIASHSNRSDADSMKGHRAEHKRAVATNTLPIFDRHQQQSASHRPVHSSHERPGPWDDQAH